MKKCPYCAEEIQDEAIVCRYCGRDLPKELVPDKQPLESRKQRTPKKVWLAVLLNMIPLIMGLGYLYLGKPGRFFVVLFIQLFSRAPMTGFGLREYNSTLLVIVWIISIIDVYGQAKKYLEVG